jgi:hypothetical protein
VGGSVTFGATALTSGSYQQSTFEIQNLSDSTNTDLVTDITGPSGEFNAFTLSVIVELNGGGPAGIQQDLYWVTTSGSTVSVTSIATEQSGTAGVAYILAESGGDLAISHSEIGRTVDVVAAISGLRQVAP